jgi:hypothetical protein
MTYIIVTGLLYFLNLVEIIQTKGPIYYMHKKKILCFLKNQIHSSICLTSLRGRRGGVGTYVVVFYFGMYLEYGNCNSDIFIKC